MDHSLNRVDNIISTYKFSEQYRECRVEFFTKLRNVFKYEESIEVRSRWLELDENYQGK